MPPAHETRRPRILCLTGFMGSGKTTIGRLLARQIGWHFADVDKEINELAGLSIPEIFDRLGEAAFREMESSVLMRLVGEAIEQDRPTVIALGGGTLAQPHNLAFLRGSGCLTVWLDCPMEDLLPRCARITNRPLFKDEASFRELYLQRLPFYEQAEFRVENTEDPARVVERILALKILERVSA